jgi:hypothetical protein
MTAKRDSKLKSKERKRPKLEKERLKDLSADGVADNVKGGGRGSLVVCDTDFCTANCITQGC